MTSATSKTIFMFKISLKYSKPEVWRRVLIPGDYTFKDLHHVIVIVMGWSDFHMHKFTMKHPVTDKEIEIGGVGDLGYGDYLWLPESTKIAHYFINPKQKAIYEYDFGSPWYHILLFEKTIPADSKQKYPYCVAGKRATPPEEDPGSDLSDSDDMEFFDLDLVNTYLHKYKQIQPKTTPQSIGDDSSVQQRDTNFNNPVENSSPRIYSTLEAQKENVAISESVDDSKVPELNSGVESQPLLPRKRKVIHLETQSSEAKEKQCLSSGDESSKQQRGTNLNKPVKNLSQLLLSVPLGAQKEIGVISESVDNSKGLKLNSSVESLHSSVLPPQSSGVIVMQCVPTINANKTTNNTPEKNQSSQNNVSIMSKLENDVDEDIEDAYGKYVASQMRLITDLEAREELRIEIQKAIKKYRFKKS